MMSGLREERISRGCSDVPATVRSARRRCSSTADVRGRYAVPTMDKWARRRTTCSDVRGRFEVPTMVRCARRRRSSSADARRRSARRRKSSSAVRQRCTRRRKSCCVKTPTMVRSGRRRKACSDLRGRFEIPTMVQSGRRESSMVVDIDATIPCDREDSPMDVDGDYVNETAHSHDWQLQTSFTCQLHVYQFHVPMNHA